jgi:hypothetical protein
VTISGSSAATHGRVLRWNIVLPIDLALGSEMDVPGEAVPERFL